ncbi:MAG: TATA-box-binding protein [Candidatus Altiarchaeota archaeon]
MKIKAKVENIVSSITIDRHIDLPKFARTVKGIENPSRFPGVIYRVKEPKLAMLIFRTGKVICSGARSKKEIDQAVEKLIKKLREGSIRLKSKPIVEIQNIVASASLGFQVNLDTLAIECMNTEYEPEQFPGLVFRLDKPKTVMLIFRSGKIIITGAKTPGDANKAAERTREMVKSYNAIIG